VLEILISPGRHFLRPSNNINVVLVLGCEESGKMNFCGASQLHWGVEDEQQSGSSGRSGSRCIGSCPNILDLGCCRAPGALRSENSRVSRSSGKRRFFHN
jgi:hypothetical protein